MIRLYTTHCPNCKTLEKMLEQNGIEYEMIEDKDKIVEVGRREKILSAPILEIDGKFYKIPEAFKVIRGINS